MQVVVHTLPMLDTTSTDTRTAVNRKPPAANSKIAPANTNIKTKSLRAPKTRLRPPQNNQKSNKDIPKRQFRPRALQTTQ